MKDAAFEEPGCCFLVMRTTRNVVVRRGVWRGKPFMNALPQLVP
jgi:hypothetical protein